MALPGKPISVTSQNPTKKKQLSDLKKSKIFVGNKNVEIFKETLYHHLDIANTCSTEKIQSQIGLYKSKAQLPTVIIISVVLKNFYFQLFKVSKFELFLNRGAGYKTLLF